MVILFSTQCLLSVYMYIDPLKLKAYKLFKNGDADLSWLLFLKEPTCLINTGVHSRAKCILTNDGAGIKPLS